MWNFCWNEKDGHCLWRTDLLNLLFCFIIYMYYIITQIILALWLVLAYDPLEDRRTIDVNIKTFFPLCFTKAESFEHLDNILRDCAKNVGSRKSCRGIEQVREAGRKRKRRLVFKKRPRKSTQWAVSVGSRARLNQTQNWSSNYSTVRNHCFVSNETSPIFKIWPIWSIWALRPTESRDHACSFSLGQNLIHFSYCCMYTNYCWLPIRPCECCREGLSLTDICIWYIFLTIFSFINLR